MFAKLAADKGYSLTYENPGAQGGVDGWEVSIPGTNQYTYTTNPCGSVTMHRGGTTFRNMDAVYSGEQVSFR